MRWYRRSRHRNGLTFGAIVLLLAGAALVQARAPGSGASWPQAVLVSVGMLGFAAVVILAGRSRSRRRLDEWCDEHDYRLLEWRTLEDDKTTGEGYEVVVELPEGDRAMFQLIWRGSRSSSPEVRELARPLELVER